MSYLDDYLASLKYLPAEVTRSLELIGDLDGKIKKLTEELEKKKAEFFRPKGDSDLRDRISLIQRQIGDLADEKITIVKLLCEAVIKHKQRLEADLTKLDRTLRAGNSHEEPTVKRRKEDRSKAYAGTDDFAVSYYNSEFLPDDIADTETKKYCLCNQESFGNMVECESKTVMAT